jgi:uncharacterized membrane protein (DUF485 family)
MATSHDQSIDPLTAARTLESDRSPPMSDKEASAKAESTASGKTAAEILESPDFKALVARRWTVSIVLTLILFVLYYGYILLIALDKPLMTTKVGAYTTLAIPMGIGVIVGAWALTAAYVAWANAAYDPMVEKLKKRLK